MEMKPHRSVICPLIQRRKKEKDRLSKSKGCMRQTEDAEEAQTYSDAL